MIQTLHPKLIQLLRCCAAELSCSAGGAAAAAAYERIVVAAPFWSFVAGLN